jgi:hypothetical protein
MYEEAQWCSTPTARDLLACCIGATVDHLMKDTMEIRERERDKVKD